MEPRSSNRAQDVRFPEHGAAGIVGRKTDSRAPCRLDRIAGQKMLRSDRHILACERVHVAPTRSNARELHPLNMAAGRPITKMFLARHGTSNIARCCQEGPHQPRSEIMRALASLVLLALVATPVFAQNAQPNQQQPGGPNSGAGIAGQPGSKSGPAVRSPNSTTGAGVNSDGRSSEPRSNQDAAKVPGLPGGKSGPAVKSPSSPASK